MSRYSKPQVLEALAGSYGVISMVAKRLDCGWDTARRWIQYYPETRQLFEVERAKLGAYVQAAYLKAIQAGKRWAIERALDTINAKDGCALVSRVDVTSGGQPVKVVFGCPVDEPATGDA